MTQAVAYRGRLPGLRVDPPQPRRGDDAIRLDVAAFVGLAERGPVDDPQLVEDVAQHEAVFGGDLPLALDEHGAPTHAALADAVRAFFANGGRRAHVVRVVGDGAVTLEVPVRVTSRAPLGDGLAVTGLLAGSLPLSALPAASPGGWAARVSVDVEVVDTVLALATGRDGVVELTPASRRSVDEGDALLVRRGGAWQLLWAPAAPTVAAPVGGWLAGDVVRLLRAELAVRVVEDGVATTVERFGGVRLGSGPGASPAWADLLQPAGGGFTRGRSMYLRATHADALVPVLGAATDPVAPPAAQDVPEECTEAALQLDGLVRFDPVRLFLDPALTGHTVEGLRLALELAGLDEEPRARGVHAVATVEEVALVAVPDLYHRPWQVQAVPAVGDRPRPVPAPEDGAPRFRPCDPAGETVPPAPDEPVEPPGAPAALRLAVDPVVDYDPSGLHAVAGALADLCAARGDVVAVLAMPRHAGLAEAEDLLGALAERRSAGTDVPSYAGVWHPWGAVVERRSPGRSPLRLVPPDGAVTGTIAASERARGWWVEPAGTPLAGVVAVRPLEPATALAMFDRGLNVVRRRPAGFAATSAHSASVDRTLLQLSVRRLLIAVRKLALREGVRFVFEPDDERFRTQVATTFVRFLDQLRAAGALAAYQVDVEPLATRSAAHEGRLQVDLKLAPTSPIEFLTVTLVRTGDGRVRVTG